MAGERKGITYEAIVKIALDDLKRRGNLKGEIFWNETPAGMTIEPDFTVGRDKDHPEIALLVTHSGSAKESEKKFWRNMGELVEAKTRLPTIPHVYTIAFDSVIKEDLKKIQEGAFDGQLIVGDRKYGSEFQAWVDNHDERLPSDRDKKVEAIVALAKAKGNEMRRLLKALEPDLESLLLSRQPALDELWRRERSRAVGSVPQARETFVRRGLAKAALLSVVPERRPQKNVPGWSLVLGLARPAIGGFRFVDPDLAWLASSNLKSLNIETLLRDGATEGFCNQIAKVRGLTLLEQYLAFARENWTTLRTKKGMLRILREQHAEPSRGLNIPDEVARPANVWIFDVVCAALKAKSGKAQGFGYSYLAKHPKAKRARIGKMDVGTWCSCFMNQYFNRRPGFAPPTAAVEYCAEVLAEALSQVHEADLKSLADEILARYVGKEFEATLLTHRGFDPLGAIIRLALQSMPFREERLTGAFAERTVGRGGSGATGILLVRSTLINWQSASNAGRDHKKKELCGRAVALRYSWDNVSKHFIPRPGVRRLVLIVDGTWRQEDLDALVRAGWDEIFYPDEMDKLVKAIV